MLCLILNVITVVCTFIVLQWFVHFKQLIWVCEAHWVMYYDFGLFK